MTLELLHIIISSISQESLSFIFGKQTWNLASRKDHVDVLEESFFLDFSVSENKAAILAKPSCDLEVFLDVLFQIFLTVVLHQLDLLELHSLNEGCQTG